MADTRPPKVRAAGAGKTAAAERQRERRAAPTREPLSPEEEARRQHEREVRGFARRLMRTGMEQAPSEAVAGHVLGQPEGAPPLPAVETLTGSLSVAGMFSLLNMSRREPRVVPILEALLDRMLATARQVHDWPSLRAGLREIFPEVGPRFTEMGEELAAHPDAKARGAGPDTVAGWADSNRLLAVIKLLADSMEPGGQFMERLDEFGEQTRALRHIPEADIARCADPKGTLFVSVHNPHLAHLRQSAMNFFADHHFINAPSLRESSANALVLRLVRTLSRGGIGMMVPDGTTGRVDREIELLGQPLMISDAFARIAWRTGCRLLLCFAVSNTRPVGLELIAIDLPRRSDATGDEEAYVDSVIAAFAGGVTDAMVRHPFDVGFSHRLGKRLPGAGQQGEDGADDAGHRPADAETPPAPNA